MAQTDLATAADYAEALLVTRRAKNWIFLGLLLVLVVQLLFFFLIYFQQIDLRAMQPAAVAAPTTVPTTQEMMEPEQPARTGAMLAEYLVGLSCFSAMVLVILLGAVLLLINLIMLVGRLIGVGRLTGALVWCILLGILLLPWQALLNWSSAVDGSFRIPGVLYTWQELVSGVPWGSDLSVYALLLKWARFVAFPVVALLILLTVQLKSARGLSQALGEDVGEPNKTLGG